MGGTGSVPGVTGVAGVPAVGRVFPGPAGGPRQRSAGVWQPWSLLPDWPALVVSGVVAPAVIRVRMMVATSTMARVIG